jgi:uncharacterized phage protein (TIGR01671 family)
MRQIKFRAWDNEACATRDWDYLLLHQVSRVFKTGTFDLMQFTGLKDADGREIYEGDIVRYRDLENKQRTDKVVWSKFYTTYILSGTFRWRVMDEIHVIGNIYENLELLK